MTIQVTDSKGKIHDMEVYSWLTIPIGDELLKVNIVRKRQDEFYNVPCTFDIETTSIKVETDDHGKVMLNKSFGFMYHWQFCIGETVCFGRTWQEFLSLVERLQSYTHGYRVKFAIYCHFLGFEFQFFQNFVTITSTFSREKRAPMIVRTQGIEWRCSYYLTNMSLDNWCKNTDGCTFGKKPKASYDYTKVRTPLTPMEPTELEYCYCDVRAPAQCLYTLLKEDTIASIPLTSTGYVRREFRRAVRSNYANVDIVSKTRLSVEQYELAKKAVRGGNTHALVLYANKILENLESYDIKSSYPACMLLDKVPMTRFIKVTPSREKFDRWINTKACLFTFVMEGIQIKELYHIPYIDRAHCRLLRKGRFDNGRVLSADRLEMSVTDVDWKIIESQYKWDRIVIREMHIADYGMLPYEFRKNLFSYFENKCKLEHELGKLEKGSPEAKDMAYRYVRFKNRINAAYGMMVTDIASPEIVYENGDWKEYPVDVKEALDKYYKSSNTFLAYQWGVWTVANARRRLQVMLDKVGIDTVYLDTDSVKCFKGHAHEFAEVSEMVKQQLRDNNLVVKIEDKEYYIGIWEQEDGYDQFITLGAKKYCYVQNGKAYITVAGLSKEDGAKELNEKLGGIYGFKKGAIFNKSGRTTHFYNDKPRHSITIEDCEILTGSNVAVLPTTYRLGITDEYEELLLDVQDHDWEY